MVKLAKAVLNQRVKIILMIYVTPIIKIYTEAKMEKSLVYHSDKHIKYV